MKTVLIIVAYPYSKKIRSKIQYNFITLLDYLYHVWYHYKEDYRLCLILKKIKMSKIPVFQLYLIFEGAI